MLNPFTFARKRAFAGLLLLAFLQQAFFLHCEKRRVIALVRDTAAAVQFQNPPGDVVQKIAVMGDKDHAALVLAQRVLQPRDRFRIKMVGRFVQKQNIRRFQQQFTKCDAALFTTREGCNIGIAIRATERIHRLVDLAVEIPKPLRLDLVLQGRQFIGCLIGVVGRNLVEAIEQSLLFRNPIHHIAADILGGIELRFLRQITHPDAVSGPGLAGKILVDPGHDPHQGRFAGAVDADNADLGAGIKRQPDVLENLAPAGIGLRQTFHHKHILRACHGHSFHNIQEDAGFTQALRKLQTRTQRCGKRCRNL